MYFEIFSNYRITGQFGMYKNKKNFKMMSKATDDQLLLMSECDRGMRGEVLSHHL